VFLMSELRNVVVDHYIGYGNVHDACYVLMIHLYYIIGRYYLNSILRLSKYLFYLRNTP
jgi:hypothetical protein